MWFMVKIRNNKDLLTLKVALFKHKDLFILAFTSFILGWVILFFNPVTSLLAEYYEKLNQILERYDHLITYNKNGLWIKENLDNQNRIISANKMASKKN